MKLKYIYLALLEQGPLKRFIRNFFITGNGWGLFSKYSHITKTNSPKIGYSSKDKALVAADKMNKKTGFYYSTYLCIFCNRYHLGRNRDSLIKVL